MKKDRPARPFGWRTIGNFTASFWRGTLPEVWIPPSELRDQRELLRLRIFLVRLRTRVKNCIHGTLTRHNVQVPGAYLFGVDARLQLGARLPELPMHSREAIEQELATVDFLETQIESAEKRLGTIMKVSAEADPLKTLPCVGKILSMVLMLEIGKVDRFSTAAHLASYAGLVPRVHLSGGHTRMGQVYRLSARAVPDKVTNSATTKLCRPSGKAGMGEVGLVPYLMPFRWLRSFSFSKHTYSINSSPGFSCSTRFCVHGST